MSGRIEPPEDPGRSVDEEFARLVAGIDGSRVTGPGPKEAPARARRLRAERPGRGRGGARSSRRRRRLGRPIGITSVLALIGLGVWGVATYDPRPAPVNTSPAGTAKPWADGAGVAAASPAPSQGLANPDERYFAGSPAAEWADNAAGLAAPAATAVNGVGAHEMASGYELLVEVMAAGNLDATILDGGPVTDFTRLLDPRSGVAAKLVSWIARPTAQGDPALLVTRFNPATTRLLGHTVKVRGVMSAEAGPHPGTALLTADYVFVYAVTTPTGAGVADQRVTVHRTVQLEVFNPDEFLTTPGEAWLYDYAADLSDIRCYGHDGFIEPGFGGAGAPDLAGTADPYATGNLLTAAAPAPRPGGTGGACQAVDRD
jgi:hypothetical protein